MQGSCVVGFVLGVFVAVSYAHPVHDRIAKRWAFFANNDENLKTIPHNCDEIVDQYSNGQLVMYEYKIEMARCLKGQQALKIDDSGNNYFTNALAQKYADDDDQAAKDNDDKNNYDDYEDKKSVVPQYDVNTQTTPEQQDASYYPSQDQTNFDQSHDPNQNQAAFSQSPVDNMPAPVQQDYSYYTKSSIPAAPQPPDMTSQWHVPEAVDAAKKDTVPSAPLNNPFAQFMNDQASPDTTPQADQQRSDIPAQQYQLPAAQSYNTVPSNQQAYFIDQARAWSPEDNGLFPENP